MNDTRELSATVIRVVLLGPLAAPPVARMTPEDAATIAFLFQRGPAAYGEIWSTHTAFLRREAKRLAITPVYGSEFFAEGISRRLAEAAMRRACGQSWLAIATHESAHAVAAIMCDLAVRHVRLCTKPTDPPLGGYVSYGRTPRSVREEDQRMDDELAAERASGELHRPSAGHWPVLEYCITLLAGGIGERRTGAAVNDGDWHDRWSAEQLIGQALSAPAHSERVHRVMLRLETLTEELVDENWDWIRRVAKTLRVRAALSGDDVRRLREDKHGNSNAHGVF